MNNIGLGKSRRLFNLFGVLFIVLVFWIFNYPFRTSLFTGLIFAVLTYPIFRVCKEFLASNLKIKSQAISAMITIFSVGLILGAIINFVSIQLVNEVPGFARLGYDFVVNLPENTTLLKIANNFGIGQDLIRENTNNIIKGLGFGSRAEVFSSQNIARFLDFGQQFFNIVFNQITFLIIFLLAWFNGLLFGKQWLNLIISLLPFNETESHQIKHELTLGIRNVIYANIISGLANACLAFIIMATFIIGLVPLTPSELGYIIPIIFIFQSNPVAAIVLAVLIELFIAWLNFVLLPKVILSKSKGNPLFIITSVITGIAIFGVMGFIIGPIIMIFVNTLGQIVLDQINKEKAEDLAVVEALGISQ
jgi:predicted PurR-regulated permease PerM